MLFRLNCFLCLFSYVNLLFRSVQNPGSVHIAPLGATATTAVNTNQGSVDSVQTEPTPIELAEAAAASAFETSPTEQPASNSPVFAPKVASAQVHSATTSPTDRFGATQSKEIPIQRENDIRDEILAEALKYVEDKGWTLDAIRAGINASNQPSTVEGLFSNGYDLVEYFIRDANAKMVDYMNERSKK